MRFARPFPTTVALMLVLVGPGSIPAVENESLQRHVEYLASEKLDGRLTGTNGARKAARYIAGELRKLGAEPLPGRKKLSMAFDFTAGMHDDGTTLQLEGRLHEQPLVWRDVDQVQALSFSDSDTVSGPVVFAGYGLSVPENEDYGYESYVGIDVKDKIALVLRYFPEDVDQETRGFLSRYSGLRYKAMHARELGAKAVIVVTGPRSPNAGSTVPMTFDTALAGSGITAASVSQTVADEIFAYVDGTTLEQAQEALDSGNPHVTGFNIPDLTLTLSAKVAREHKEGQNVVGYLPARPAAGKEARDSYIVLGAHFDHLGHGRHPNSLADKDQAAEIHHGADDNASGVAAVLAAARRIADGPRSHPVMLALWSGEELGLLGSSDFVDGGSIPPERIAAYLNFDMVGRLEDDKLTLQAAGSSSVWRRLIERTNVIVGLDVNVQDDPYLPTDSSSFYRVKVPTLNFFTGSHRDYHRPSDTADRINYDGIERIAHFAALMTARLDNLGEAPDYVEVERSRDATGSRDSIRAYTGTIPDYASEVEGLRLSGVIGGGPADQAGLREGDIIVEFAGRTIANIYDYTYALDAVKIDEPNKVVVMRDGQRIELEITPSSRR